MNLKANSELLILFIGFIAITVITRIIAGKIRKHLSEKVSISIYVLVCLLGIYYLFDIVLHNVKILNNLYFYFWLLVIVVQAVFCVNAYSLYCKNNN